MSTDQDTKTKITTLLGENLGKAFCHMMAHEAASNPLWISTLNEIMLEDNAPYNWRAAWVVDHIQQQFPHLINPFVTTYIKSLPTVKSDGVKRHILKIACQMSVDEIEEGELIDLCFKWMQSALTPIANKAHCIEIVYKVTCRYPDLANEFGLILEEIAINGSKGEKSKAKKILDKIRQWRSL